jgi:hypothetical protein
MNPMPKQIDRDPLLNIFEDHFEPIINQSNHVIIRHQFLVSVPGTKPDDEIITCSVNGCNSPKEFHDYLTSIIDLSISKVFESLQQFPISSWQAPIEHIEYKLQDLASIVEEESVIYNDRSGSYSHHRHFKSFTNCYLEGLSENLSLMFGQCIRLAAVKYAEVWLQVISASIDRLELKFKFFKQSMQLALVPSNQIPVPIWKFNLTVSQLGYFLNILITSGTIDIPSGQISDFLRWIVENFQSRNQSFIHQASLRNKYSSPDFNALDFWKDMSKEWTSKVQADLNRLTE